MKSDSFCFLNLPLLGVNSSFSTIYFSLSTIFFPFYSLLYFILYLLLLLSSPFLCNFQSSFFLRFLFRIPWIHFIEANLEEQIWRKFWDDFPIIKEMKVKPPLLYVKAACWNVRRIGQPSLGTSCWVIPLSYVFLEIKIV